MIRLRLNNATKTKLDHATGVGSSDLATKNILLLWKMKLKNWTLMTNISTSLNKLKRKVNKLDVGKLKNVSVDLKS